MERRDLARDVESYLLRLQDAICAALDPTMPFCDTDGDVSAFANGADDDDGGCQDGSW